MSLWAGSRPDGRGRAYDEVFAAAQPEQPPPVQPVALRTVVLVALGAVTVALALALADRDRFSRGKVRSGWNAVPMTCDTSRIDRDGGAIELFQCRSIGAGTLPPGLYLSPGSRWISDVTGREALFSAIEISRAGELTGWAAYGASRAR